MHNKTFFLHVGNSIDQFGSALVVPTLIEHSVMYHVTSHVLISTNQILKSTLMPHDVTTAGLSIVIRHNIIEKL